MPQMPPPKRGQAFEIVSDYQPAGDQPQAIAALCQGLGEEKRDQVLLGVTGSGKTFTMANIIAQLQRPALIMAHNKTLAAQLYGEFKSFFPNNAVEYFVSYYDYYQPEAYIPKTDTFIEKDSAINEQIDRMRHSATRALLERRDTIVVASVSCIYGLGSPELYMAMVLELARGQSAELGEITRQLIAMQYTRNDIAFTRGTFRQRGDILDIFPSHAEDRAWRMEFFGDEIAEMWEFDALTGEKLAKLEGLTIYANSHHVTPRPTMIQAVEHIKIELKEQLAKFNQQGKLLEAQRIEQRTRFDIEMIVETGMCKGIENYSRYLTGRAPGEPPPTLFEYLPDNALLFVDESHVTVPQIGGMSSGDRARKNTLVEHGFRLPSALDNRPLKFEEWDTMRPQTVYVSATPAPFEIARAGGISAEQVIRPTGLIDPPCEVRPVEHQVDDVIAECRATVAKGMRVLITTLTKKMAENLAEYLQDAGLKVTYLHSDIDTLERTEILRDLRHGVVDILIGINLLREGLDIPECGLVAILDADKTGFLRSETALIQTIGRAARNAEGRVVLYADVMTAALKSALSETERRRVKQITWNRAHNITPQSIIRAVAASMQKDAPEENAIPYGKPGESAAPIENLRKKMLEAAASLEFEEAARLRDVLHHREQEALGLPPSGFAEPSAARFRQPGKRKR